MDTDRNEDEQFFSKSASYHIRNVVFVHKQPPLMRMTSSGAAMVTTYFIYYMIIPSGVHHSFL